MLLTLLASCSTTKNIDKAEVKIDRKEFSNMQFDANISTQFPDFNQTFMSQVKIAGHDSVSLTAFGPFGVTVAKLYANTDKFIFYNIFENSIYQGKPSSENLYKAAKINLSFRDLIGFLRGETPEHITDYKIYDENDEQTVYANKAADNSAEFIVVSKSMRSITQYQRKDKSNELELNVFLTDFKKYDGTNLASKIVFDFPKMNGKLTLELDKIELNKPYNGGFRFNYPSSATVRNLD